MHIALDMSSPTDEFRQARVLVVNEPRSYREAIAEAMRVLRPSVEIMVANPDKLEELIPCFAPDMVICSKVNPVTESNVLIWVELYPEHGSRSVVNVQGRDSEFEQIELSDLLSFLDHVESMIQGN